MLSAAAFLAVSTALAAAAPATVQKTANVRSGPGTNFPVVASLRSGSVVDVGGCGGSWCRIESAAASGYMARSLLALGGTPPAVAVAPVPAYEYDDYPGFDYPGYAYGPVDAITIVPRHRHRWRNWHHRPGGGWAGRPPRPPVVGVPSGGGGGVKSFGQAGRGGFGGGAPAGGGGVKPMTGGVGAGAPAVRPSAPAAAAPAGSVPSLGAGRK
jgi:uncharacterized protein YraI